MGKILLNSCNQMLGRQGEAIELRLDIHLHIPWESL